MTVIDRTVVVTGLGATTPLGGDTASTWRGLLAGRSGVRPLRHEWAGGAQVRIAAEAAVEPREVLPEACTRRLDRAARFALVAAREAWSDAGFTGRAGAGADVRPERLGVVVASAIGGMVSLLDQYEMLKQQGPRGISPFALQMMMASTPSSAVGRDINARAGVHGPVSACVTGAEAIGYGIEVIRTGRADVVLAGGTEAAICSLTLAAFAGMTAMSRRNDDPAAACRPYDVDRDGFVMGEGAGVLVLEAAEHAARRGARVYAEAVGQGLSADSHHITRPEPSGQGITAALAHLLDACDLEPGEIVHVNAHATGTPMGDVAETAALRKVFGDDTGHFAVSATKSMTGHLLGGAGGVESVAAILALRDRLAPATLNLDTLDPEVEGDIVRGSPRALPAGRIAALNNSFGFGGHNVVLAFRTL